MNMLPGCLAVAMAASGAGAPHAQSVVTGDNGMPLYTLDQDRDGKSVCYQQCAHDWPPFLGAAGSDRGAGWTLLRRADGTMQWSRNGKPAYYYIGDTPGHARGDGIGGVWHVMME